MALVDRINDLTTERQSINEQLARLQAQAQPLQERKQQIAGELSDLQVIAKNRASFEQWKAAQP